MNKTALDTMLIRTDATKNMHRFYRVGVQPNLFGGFSVIRNWGRIGCAGQTKIQLLENDVAAHDQVAELLHAKKKRGYRPIWSELQNPD